MNILVAGAAGFIGSVVTAELVKDGHKVIALDNLAHGHKEAVSSKASFIKCDICDVQGLENIFSQNKIDAVVHLAAETVVEFSVTDPKRYFDNNIVGGLNLLNNMVKHGVHKIIFSSSAAVYGEARTFPITEDHPKEPVNSYGETKLMFESILKWYGSAYVIKHVSFRYFNAAGATEWLGEDRDPETHLIANVLRAAREKNGCINVFGTDYQTEDGSCIRDYVHVVDIAGAHILALNKLDSVSGRAYNLGSGKGHSVLEVVNVSRKVTGIDIPMKICPRRAGDPAILLASSERAKQELGWTPLYPDIEKIVSDTWLWMKQHPNGYAK